MAAGELATKLAMEPDHRNMWCVQPANRLTILSQHIRNDDGGMEGIGSEVQQGTDNVFAATGPRAPPRALAVPALQRSTRRPTACAISCTKRCRPSTKPRLGARRIYSTVSSSSA